MTTTEQSPAAPAGARPEPGPDRRGLRRLLAALAGLLAAAVALGAGQLVAGFVRPASSPVVAVGDAVITLTPEAVKSFAIRTFGENDKVALVVGTLVLLALYALVLGVLALRRRWLGVAGIALFGLIGVVAALTRPAGGLLDALPSVVGAAAGVVALLALLRPLTPPAPAVAATGTGTEARDEEVVERLRAALAMGDRKGAGLDRRRFFVTSGVALGVAALAGGGGQLLRRRFDVADARGDITMPTPASPAAPLPRGADLAEQVDGLTPLFTPNRDFYRVDTAITTPQIRPAEYRLTLSGMFDQRRTFTLQDLFDRSDLIERDITLTCVSNEVGGELAGTARWIGVPLGDFLRENGIQDGSTQLVCRSTDGMTIGAPTGAALRTPDAMLAFGMNGEPLPVEHGFPVRMIIPGLYGYVSACKWLTEIEASTFEAFDAYWVERGWAAQGPIKTAARIDTPGPLRPVRAGRRAVAGVAWAQGRGISKVEVRIDDGDWQEAELSPEVDADVWRQWVLPVDLDGGHHEITVRATDGGGDLQTEDRASPFPDGASGWHSVRVLVT
ncbi:molybdopterin-dependent oxidoreductase [Geodermatophilus sp. SYSU D00691]